MFERFTREARRVVVLAETEAKRLGHRHLGTEHLLLGILDQGTGPAARALTGLGVTAERVEREVVSRLGRCAEEFGQTDAEALHAIGIDLEEVQRRVEAAFGPGALRPVSPRKGRLCWTKRAKRALELSLREARILGHRHLGSEHVLLGVVVLEAGLAARILLDLGVDRRAVKDRVLDELRRAS
jgi:ATP-dependent Clp protease ATP-binding subunit ClpA